MERYLWACINFKQNNWAKLLPTAEFAYSNAKNVNTGHTLFELNYGYHLCVSFEKDTNSHSQSKTADKLLAKLWELMIVCQENLYHAQNLPKRAFNKGVKLKSYIARNKVWLDSKYIKTKLNKMFKAKFFKLYQVLHPISKQAYKLKLLKR